MLKIFIEISFLWCSISLSYFIYTALENFLHNNYIDKKTDTPRFEFFVYDLLEKLIYITTIVSIYTLFCLFNLIYNNGILYVESFI